MDGDPATAYVKADEAQTLPMQGAEGAAGLALRAAIWAGDRDRIRKSAAGVIGSASSGPVESLLPSRSQRPAPWRSLMAGLPRRCDAIREATTGLDALGQPFDAAEVAVDALILMSGDPEIRRIAAEHRSVFESVGARPGTGAPGRGPGVDANSLSRSRGDSRGGPAPGLLASVTRGPPDGPNGRPRSATIGTSGPTSVHAVPSRDTALEGDHPGCRGLLTEPCDAGGPIPAA